MKFMKSRTKLLAAVMCGAALAGCNAIESVDDSAVIPTPPNTVVINGQISGLSATRPIELTMALTNNGVNNTSRVYSVRGTNVLRFGAVNVGANYAITITKTPFNRTCTIENGSGTATGAEINNVTVTCVPNSTPTYTLTATIAAGLVAAPPAGFKVTLTTEEGSETITPTAGQTSVTFTLPIIYPGANPPAFDYRVTATNTVGGTTNNCVVSAGTGSLGSGSGNITGVQVTGCLFTFSAAATYSTTPACASNPASTTNQGCTPAIVAGTASPMGTGGLQLGLKKVSTGVIVDAPLITAYSTTPVAFPGTYASNTDALYEVVVRSHPAGQHCIVLNGGMAQLTIPTAPATSIGNVVVQVRCRDLPATANQLRGVYQLNPPAINNSNGEANPLPLGQTRNFLTFFPNGTFIYGTHPSTALAGVEYGFYNYISGSQVLQFTIHTDTNGTTANNFDHGLSGRSGFAGGAVSATSVVRTAGSLTVPATLSMRFGLATPIPVAPATTPAANLNPVLTFAEPINTLGEIQGTWVTADGKRVFVYNKTTFYGFHAGVNGAPNLQDACFTILNAAAPESFYTRRGGDTGCMTATANPADDRADGRVATGTVDVPNATTTNTTAPLINGFAGRLPGSISNAVIAPGSPVRYSVTAGAPDTLVLQDTLNDNPVGDPVTFTRFTTF